MWERFKKAWKIAGDMEQKAADLTPMSVLPVWKSNKAIWKDWTTDNAVKHGYKASTWVYSCISRISKTAASVPWKVYKETDQGLEEIPNHPLEQLLKRPNPYMSGGDIMERLVSHLYLGGNTVLSKVRANNIVAELWPLSPDQVSPIPTNNQFISGYEYKINGQTQFIEASEIIHVMFVDPANPYWGLSPLQAVARVVDTDTELVNFQMVSLQNRAITDGVFSFKQPLTKDQWEDARNMVREQHQGTGNARTPWVLGGEAQWQQMSLSPAEMDFIQSRNFTREEICSVFNVPPPMIGLYDNATLNNIETARKIFWLDTMIPLLEDLKSAFNLSLTPEFGEGIVLSYDVSNVQAIQDNFGEKVTTAKELWTMGIPFNMINQRLELGFDDVEGGDVGYLPLNVVIAGETDDVNVTGNEDEDVTVIAEDAADDEEAAGNKFIKPRRGKAWNLDTDEQKDIYWKKTDDRRLKWEAQFADRVEKLFTKEANSVVKAFKQSGLEGALHAIGQNEDSWNQIAKAMYLAIIEDFGSDTWDLLKKQAPKEIKELKAFDPWSENIQEWVRNRAADLITHVTETTKDLIRNVIAMGMDEGQGVTKIAQAIRERYEGFTKRRSETIARTETVSASNFGSMASAQQTGLNPMKVWVSSRDKRVRDTHKDVDGVMVGMNEEFHVGGDTMLFPGGGSLAKENVHCRCTLSYRVNR